VIQVIRKHKGLGDTVEFLTEVTGIAYAVRMAEEHGLISDCGCTGRKKWLNENVSYGRKDSEVLQGEPGGEQEEA
jgi:hypothetical protein